ncbi:hypothetical protein RUM43_003892 [Polyplax serrata]|uniref:Uncharacterized protein n=1 Tax=Polyplax serrata TaxID=468196 RepID=A0AAN8S2I5_POLSC
MRDESKDGRIKEREDAPGAKKEMQTLGAGRGRICIARVESQKDLKGCSLAIRTGLPSVNL